MKSNNLFVVGSESFVATHFIKKYRTNFSKVIGIDIKPTSSSILDDYLQIDFSHKSYIPRLHNFLQKIDINFSSILFTSGVNYMNDIFSLSIEEWENTYNINLKSVVFILKELLNYMSNTTSIVLIASQNGVVAHEKRIDYGTSKSALIQLAKNLSLDFTNIKDKDIRINCLSPSYIENQNNQKYLNSAIGKKLLQKIPYKKFITLTDTSDTIDFLLSPKSKALRGQNLILDYGYTIV
ncbi:SDR family NAD(P)-dependent oxidoreductase [Limosilactobacillus reuteri]|uniref:SDR family oxidoreductase n=1 Tax=Limosilactobacillus reuteri TaxID=1598 RepID=A0AB36AG95_LIMRT|nr:SDR family oxidoreductase [Limosilactobacillus reuteri]MRG84627.1 SDR family oxidoreductase [Limosilactobacillus reuteri]OCW64074.1 oxidoreductase [Limosilactobacillus reuteri]OCW65306.1 oxidoreductase [Limosilactobacillus reuteri]OCW67069.1 oxidoreductase [Limosilactobacillus reuteri]OCW68278.1 oxidoreductase [Limosilactobacillus reuteri]